MGTNEFFPDYLVPPGDTLEELLEHYDMTQADLAERMGRTPKFINELIQGKAALLPKTALQLERVFGVEASFWNNLEKNYRQKLAEQEYEKELKEQLDFLERCPVRFMTKKGWIKKEKDKTKQLKELLSFFGVASYQAWKEVWGDALLNSEAAFRKSPSFPSHAEAVAVWLRQGERKAREMDCASYNEQTFKETLHEIRALSDELPEVFMPKLQELCAKAGVAVVFVPEAPKSRVSGATMWKGKTPLIILSFKYKKNDHFWFTFFHEAGHIIKHSKKMTFLEFKGHENDHEEEANQFSANLLIPSVAYRRFVRESSFNKEHVIQFAEEVGVGPGIVVGRLQHDKHLPFNSPLNKLKKSYELTEEQEVNA